MRFVLCALLAVFVSLPAAARPRKRTHTKPQPAPVTHVLPGDRAAKEHARAEAELADLRAGRIRDDAAPAEPAQVWAVQENDREVPAPLQRKK